MGLCKCPKRKVTNQFCFEHRVNVCEFCLTSSHPKCIVNSYLHWLQDSDFNPICKICGDGLAKGECIRLTCYDVFHWDCLNREALKLPGEMDSSGFLCTICKTSVFPSEKLVSPVADAVRKKLATVAWGRKRLGLPVQTPAPSIPKPFQAQNDVQSTPKQNKIEESSITQPQVERHETHHPTERIAHIETPSESQDQSHLLQQAVVTPQNTYVREKFQNEASRRVVETKKEEKIDLTFDHDDDKYRRKGVRHWLSRLFRLRSNVKYAADDPNITFKRVAVIMLLVVLGFMTVILILTRVGRDFADHDRHLDPKFNPNIRVADIART